MSKEQIDPIQQESNKRTEGMEGTKPSQEEVDNTNNETTISESEYVPLPSQGLFYTGQFNGIESLKFRKLDWTDEDILTTPSYYEDNTAHIELLKQTIVDERGFDVEKLVPVDKDAILIWLRMTIHGPEYQTQWYCTNPNQRNKTNKCDKEPQKAVWDLSQIEAPNPNEKYYDELKENGYIIHTTQAGDQIPISIPSIGYQRQVQKYLEEYFKENYQNRGYLMTMSLLLSIPFTPKGEYGYKAVHNWLLENRRKFGLKDSKAVREKAVEINMSIDYKKDLECKHCGHVEEGVQMPITANFFWPDE